MSIAKQCSCSKGQRKKLWTVWSAKLLSSFQVARKKIWKPIGQSILWHKQGH